MTKTTYITIGKIGAPHGVRGWVKVQAFSEHGPEAILDYLPWFVSIADAPFKPIKLESAHAHGKGLLAKFKGFDSPEVARALTNALLGVPRAQLPAPAENEYYWSDLIGLTVINQDGTVYGKVISLLETGSNDVLVVKGDKEHGIPFLLGSVIRKVDLEKQEIHVDWELI